MVHRLPGLLVGLAFCSGPRAHAAEFVVHERVGLAVHLHGAETTDGQIEAVLKRLESVTALETDLQVQSCAREEIARCMGFGRPLFVCAAIAAQPSYRRWFQQEGRQEEFASWSKGTQDPVYLLLLTLSATEDGTLISAHLVDARRSLALLHRRQKKKLLSPGELDMWSNVADRAAERKAWDSLEDEIISKLIVAVRPPERLAGPQGLGLFVERLFKEDWVSILESEHRRINLVDIELEVSTEAGAETDVSIRLDGEALGRSSSGSVLLRDVSVGTHVLELSAEGHGTAMRRIELTESATVKVGLTKNTSATPTVLRKALWSSGGVAAVGGLALLFSSLGNGSNACIVAAGQTCDGGGNFDVIDGTTLKKPALGSALVLGGTTWAVLGLLGDESTYPWLEFLVGTAVGLATFGLAHALDPSPVCIEDANCRVFGELVQ